MDGTCIETPPQILNEDDEPVTFSFHTDISANPQVIKTVLQINQGVHKTFTSIGKYLEGWRRYKVLWKLDKVFALLNLLEAILTVVA